MRRVILTEEQNDHAVKIGTERFTLSGGKTLWGSDYTALEYDIAGARGEVAVCVVLGLDYHEQVVADPTRKNHDLTKPNGRTIEVRTRIGDKGNWIIAKYGREFCATFGVFCLDNNNGIDVVGYFTQSMWNKYRLRRDFTGGVRDYFPSFYLRPIT